MLTLNGGGSEDVVCNAGGPSFTTSRTDGSVSGRLECVIEFWVRGERLQGESGVGW